MKFTSPSTSVVLAALALASSATAHFTLDYPATRGFDEDLEPQNFCGGFPNVSLPRQPWYYRNGPVEIDSHHDSATVNIYISYGVPTSAQSFLAAQPLRHDLAIKGEGEFCFHANASADAGASAGTNATIMVEFISTEHGHLYQCSDVVFTDDAKVGANVTCTDALTAASAGSGEAASSSSASSGSAATSSAAPSSSSSSAPAKSNSNGAVAMASVPVLGLALVPALLAGALSLA